MMVMMMKSGLSGLFLLLSSSVSALGSVVLRSYYYLPFHVTWQDAQNFCRSSNHYTDLATIYRNSETNGWKMKTYNAWIGLHKPHSPLARATSDWIWANGEENTFDAWAQYEPDSGETCASINYTSKRFHGSNCGNSYFFFCHELDEDTVVHRFIPQSVNRSEAQQYCRENFVDLAAFKDDSVLDSVVTEQDFPVWTGLHRDGNTWKWSTGSSEFRKWASDEPGSNGDCVSISSKTKEMATQNCTARFPFICQRDRLVLVKENKTWEEALEHCQTLNSSFRFELVSVEPEKGNDYMMSKVDEASSEKVWTGLRYLAGHWLWVNEANVLHSNLAVCPLMGRHCGALSKKDTGSVEPADCSQKLNFLCYSM